MNAAALIDEALREMDDLAALRAGVDPRELIATAGEAIVDYVGGLLAAGDMPRYAACLSVLACEFAQRRGARAHRTEHQEIIDRLAGRLRRRGAGDDAPEGEA